MFFYFSQFCQDPSSLPTHSTLCPVFLFQNKKKTRTKSTDPQKHTKGNLKQNKQKNKK